MSDIEKRSTSDNEIQPAPSVDVEKARRESDAARHALHGGPPPFRWASLWEPAQINPLNGKSYTLPILNLRDQYAINFHLAWLGFFVAFLSWFAFPPLIPEAIRADLKLTTEEVGNSNIIALLATLFCRFLFGPLVDRFGPRLTMAGVLAVGAIPSGLAGTISSASGLYAIRFFIGILGASFVPCLAWTTTFFDKSIVGTANSLVGGWGNMGGGVTFVVQVAVFQRLVDGGMSSHSAWRTAFAIVPVPVLLLVSAATLFFGTDHPAGKWAARHTLPATAVAARQGHLAKLDAAERAVIERKMQEKKTGSGVVQAASDDEDDELAEVPLDVAVAEKLTLRMFLDIIKSPTTWLPALMYMTTFGFELAVDANLPNVLVAAHKSPHFGQLEAGYYTSAFGLMNIVTRPFGGYLADRLYARYKTPTVKKYITITLGFLQGMMSLAYGLYSRSKYNAGSIPDLSTQMGLVALMAIFCEVANGTNFSLVPHCSPLSPGTVAGLVGAMGNLGGIIFAIIFRFDTLQAYSKAFIISGALAAGVNLFVILLPAPKK